MVMNALERCLLPGGIGYHLSHIYPETPPEGWTCSVGQRVDLIKGGSRGTVGSMMRTIAGDQIIGISLDIPPKGTLMPYWLARAIWLLCKQLRIARGSALPTRRWCRASPPARPASAPTVAGHLLFARYGKRRNAPKN